MATIITQKPLYKTLVPVGQEIIFALQNDTVVQAQVEVKFVARVHISDDVIVSLSNTGTQIGIFRTVPNNVGTGIFDFRNVIETYVSADHTTGKNADVKTVSDPVGGTYPLHLVDKLSRNKNLAKFFAVQFSVEYLDTATGVIIEQDFANSTSYNIFNGYISYDAILKQVKNNFGFDMETAPSYVIGAADSKFLTNMPTTQYVNAEDYLTLTLFRENNFASYVISSFGFDNLPIPAATITVLNNVANGGGAYNNNTQYNFLYMGVGTGNIRQWFSGFDTALTNGELNYYTIKTRTNTGSGASATITIYVNCPTLKGYEPIRLCWLNQWGGWDYYTFTKKSSKTFTTKGTTYNQLGGSWNESSYKINSFKGGKKSFRVNTTEKIKINTDFITEDEGKAFEYLINSPEVMLLDSYISETTSEFQEKANNQYAQPVRLTTKNITRKTIANDKLIQFTFEIEKTKTLRTQSI